MIKKQFESSSSSAVYTAWFNPATNEDGCDCKGWTFKRATGPRRCKHTEELRKGAPVAVAAPKPKPVVVDRSAEDAEVEQWIASAPVNAPSTAIPSPMLASPLAEGIHDPSQWVAEEKYDGHRILARVSGKTVTAVSRNDKHRPLPTHVLAVLMTFPDGVYDGELMVAGKTSSAVKEKANEGKLFYVIFDILETNGVSVTGYTYEQRRCLLDVIFAQRKSPHVVQSATYELKTSDDIKRHTVDVWNRKGEGLILKRKSSVYLPGKRSKDWVKIKMLQTAVLTITGYEDGKSGPHSTVVVKDAAGNVTTVKTLNNNELRRLDKDPSKAIGRKLRIEFQDRTADGSYRHPRWDRYEDE